MRLTLELKLLVWVVGQDAHAACDRKGPRLHPHVLVDHQGGRVRIQLEVLAGQLADCVTVLESCTAVYPMPLTALRVALTFLPRPCHHDTSQTGLSL